ncbi:MAG: NDP-sugar synthase, partial [Candidatus Eremiobacteraeota bacterium]|nr:NDP-sugar synthase [Candidatus Eremiobacteraeota bacterium]
GVDDVVINVHYFPEAVRAYVGDGARWGVRVTYLHEPELMGSAGAVRAVADRFHETFVVIGCDDVTDIDLAAAIAYHRQRAAEATIVLARVDDVSQYGAVVTGPDGRITGFQEKPARGTERSRNANTGVYIFEPRVLERIPAETFYDFGKQVFPALLAAGAAFYGMSQDAYWCDIGTPAEYRRAHADALHCRVKLRLPEGASLDAGVLRGAGARVSAAAAIGSPACIGARSIVEEGAHVADSILWQDVRVERGAAVRGAVLGSGAVVAANALVEGGEYGRGARLP